MVLYGNVAFIAYKLRIFGKIARHKSLSMIANRFDSDFEPILQHRADLANQYAFFKSACHSKVRLVNAYISRKFNQLGEFL
jgi:hypothetical protein